MKTVKRFKFKYTEPGMFEHTDGDYVLYTDYQALDDKWQNANSKMRSDLHKAQARIEKLEQANKIMLEALKNIDNFDNHDEECESHFLLEDESIDDTCDCYKSAAREAINQTDKIMEE